MIELLVLVAIAYAGARGVESMTGTADRRHDTAAAEKTVAKVAAAGPKEDRTAPKQDPAGPKEPPGPTEPGGTFSAIAPRSAKAGGKAAVPLAVLTETGSTMWKATVEGYRERWPEIRAERRKKLTERAARRKADKETAQKEKEAQEAAAKAGPPPAYPPAPAEPPKPGDPAPQARGPEGKEESEPWAWDTWPPGPPGEGEEPVHVITTVPEPRTDDADPKRVEAEERAAKAEKEARAAREEATTAREQAATDKVLAAQKAVREADARTAEAGQRTREAEERAREAGKQATEPSPPSGRRHLTVVPTPAQNGAQMSSLSTILPEIRTLNGLMSTLTLTKAMCEMRAEEALAISADDFRLANLLDRIESQMADFEVDDKTRAEVDVLRESIHTQATAAARYGTAAKDAGDFAVATAQAAYKSHGGIAEAVQSSPIEQAAQAGYYGQ
ncbi:hypothetical protein ACFXKG_30730 [Streptomyces sp. NPDC059255]|uniref:hypothetical protein n=1 Tax=Streptomyces sp. NPDC059255 TaxID=3346793 RepID=UPI00367B9A64